MTEAKSAVQQIEEQGEEQTRIKVTQAIARTGAADPEGVVESLSTFPAARELKSNQEEFAAKIKAIKSNLDLSSEERLEAGRQAAQEAQDRYAELSSELVSQSAERERKLNRTLFSGGETLALSALADLDEGQLDIRADLAHASENAEMLKAIRVVAATKGFGSIVEKTVGWDPDPAVSGAYLERQKLQRAGGLQALSRAYAPAPVKAEQLQPDTADIQRARDAKASQERSATRIMAGTPGITDVDFSPRGTRQVGSRRY
jgi:hypothetical protein